MTDERMDARLRDAGEQWRADHVRAAAIDSGAFSATEYPIDITPTHDARPRRRRNAWAAGLSSIAAAAIAVVIALNLHSSGSGGGGPAAVNSGTDAIQGHWVLLGMADSQGHPFEPVADATLQFTGTTIAGTDGCNHIGGDVTLTNTSFDVGQGLATTDLACVDRPSGFDTEVTVIHDVLRGTVLWSIDTGQLTLTGPSGAKLFYVRPADVATITDPRAIVGGWALDTVAGVGPDAAASSAIPGSQGFGVPFVQFNSDGTYVTEDGCNGGDGLVTIAAGLMTIKPGTGETKTCAGAVDAQARQFNAVLDGNVVWSIRSGYLMITKTDVGYLIFRLNSSPSGLVQAPTGAPDFPVSSGANGSSGSSGTGSSSQTSEPPATASDLPSNK